MKRGGSSKPAFRWFIMGTALIMMGIGVYNGEEGAVLTKAIQICLECIGIG